MRFSGLRAIYKPPSEFRKPGSATYKRDSGSWRGDRDMGGEIWVVTMVLHGAGYRHLWKWASTDEGICGHSRNERHCLLPWNATGTGRRHSREANAGTPSPPNRMAAGRTPSERIGRPMRPVPLRANNMHKQHGGGRSTRTRMEWPPPIRPASAGASSYRLR